MSKSGTRRGSRQPIFIILGISLVLSLGYVYFNASPKNSPQSAGIFVVTSAPTYGDTSVSGILRKDSPAGVSGKYILVNEDGIPIILDSSNIDNLLGSPVVVKGNLSPSVDGVAPMTMTVKTIEVWNP